MECAFLVSKDGDWPILFSVYRAFVTKIWKGWTWLMKKEALCHLHSILGCHSSALTLVQVQLLNPCLQSPQTIYHHLVISSTQERIYLEACLLQILPLRCQWLKCNRWKRIMTFLLLLSLHLCHEIKLILHLIRHHQLRLCWPRHPNWHRLAIRFLQCSPRQSPRPCVQCHSPRIRVILFRRTK